MASVLGLGTAAVVFWKIFLPKISLDTYKKICWEFAKLDDEICRNELDGNFINGERIKFPPKEESIHYRYNLFLDYYKKYSIEDLKKERKRLLNRHKASTQYINTTPQELKVE